MTSLDTCTLQGYGVELEPLEPQHASALREAAADGELWRLWYTSVPSAGDVERYVQDALEGQRAGHMLPWVVREAESKQIIGSTRYHDIDVRARRVEIGYTFYAASWQRTHVNTACKLLLLTHAFESLQLGAVGFRTDRFNVRSQRAIEGLGAKLDGVLRHHQCRKDGTVRDSVMYSILASEWPDVRRHLQARLSAPRS